MDAILATYGWDLLILVLAGALAGLINGVVGSGTLITFPIMLLMGYPPLVANVSNNLGLIPGSTAAAWQYRHELWLRRHVVLKMLPLTITGAAAGSLLLLVLPSEVFSGVVPVLIVAALVVVLAQPFLQRAVRRRTDELSADGSAPARLGWPLIIGLPLMGAYGGYFGAAQGVLLLVILGIVLALPYSHVNGIKNVLAGVANLVSGLLFIFIAPDKIDWVIVACIALGSIVGGAGGGRIAQKLPQSAYRAIIIVVGLAALWSILSR